MFVRREDGEGIATLVLDRPERLNALGPALFVELRDHLEAIAKDVEGVACVVLRGEGRAFSSGADLKGMQEGERAASPHFHAETVDRIETLPQPVIASVHGYCYTGGLELVLACDLVIASESARFADTHARWAMVPMWGLTARLPRRIGALRAREMMFAGRVVTGAEAVGIGLANRCVPDAELPERTRELARALVANSWFSLREQKKLIREGLARSLPDAVLHERTHSPGSGPDFAERMRAFSRDR